MITDLVQLGMLLLIAGKLASILYETNRVSLVGKTVYAHHDWEPDNLALLDCKLLLKCVARILLSPFNSIFINRDRKQISWYLATIG